MKPFHYNQDPLYTASASILQAQQLTEDIVAFNNIGFKQLNGLMSDDEIHNAINSTIKSAAQKLSDSTWDVVTDIYGRRKNSTWAGDWILARKLGGVWLTIKNGGSFKAQDSIDDVLSFFETEEEMEEGDEGFYSQKMIKNQLQTIVRNSNDCLKMVEDNLEFPEWAQSEIAVAENGIVSVTEFMQSHNSDKKEIHEAPSSFKMGTATITKSGHFMDGKQVDIFHKFDDGRINAQYRKNDGAGKMVHNMTLTKDQYKLDEAKTRFYRLPGYVINNELYVAQKSLSSIYRSLTSGRDFDDKQFGDLIKKLNDIRGFKASFESEKDVPVSYQYTTK